MADLDALLSPGDVVVVNDTRVIPARLHLRKATGGAVEVLLLERRPEGWWEALVKPSRRVAPGSILSIGAGAGSGTGSVAGGGAGFTVEVGEVLGDDGRRRVDLHASPGASAADDLELLAAIGEIPLPPYIHEPLADPGRYQTVFADNPGSVAAPTAGLHLTDALLARLASRGIEVLRVELVVGLGTFRPITADRVEDHPMHAEHYRIPPATVAALDGRVRGRAEPGEAPGTSSGARVVRLPRRRRGSVVAIGTTVVRALESWAATGATEGSTSLFIRDDFDFALVDRLLTNFHVPRSSLLALVESFVGPRWRDLYGTALAERYRFLSFGDAMLLTRSAR